MKVQSKRGLFFSGGGARGAYQIGVLKGVGDILGTQTMPFEHISGVSAGSINAAYMASHARNYTQAVLGLEDIWSNIHCGSVYKDSFFSLSGSIVKNVCGLVSHITQEQGSFLLDTSPLWELIKTNVDFDMLNQNVDEGIIQGIDIAAIDYGANKTVAFIRSHQPTSERIKFRYSTQPTNISLNHVIASTAIPIFFPAVNIDGGYYGDGAFRNSHPLRTCISQGVDKIMILGVNHNMPTPISRASKEAVSFGKVLSMGLSSIFFDNIEVDLELLSYINSNIAHLSHKEQHKIPFRPIEYLHLKPSEDLGVVAHKYIDRLPRLLRYLLNGFGSKKQSSDFISYFLFEADYAKRLVDIGYQDAMNQAEVINKFFSDDIDKNQFLAYIKAKMGF